MLPLNNLYFLIVPIIPLQFNKTHNFVTLDMAQAVAYPDIALEKFTGLDSSEDAQAFIDLIERKIGFSLGLRPNDAGERARTG